MAAQSKIELLLTLRNKMKNGLSKARNNLKSKLGGMKSDINSFKSHHVKAFSAMKDQIPVLGNAMSLLGNPYALATAGVIALGVAMTKAVDAAGKFNHQFLELKNLNLDKSNTQIAKINDSILDLALKEGFDSTKTSQAFFDVQSALGVYGDEVEAIVGKVGRFSQATKADFTDSVNSATKAMKAFRFGSERLDEFLGSNAKTVQVGITTFNELARVQTEYGGAAAAAGQDFNTANKVFAAFTAVAKDSTIAANMTKTAFQGLTMKPTIKGLKSIDIGMFDAKGNMKDISQVIEELVPKINKMDDVQFLKFRNAIGGSEGLQALLNNLRTSGDDVLKTFKAFDKSTFDIDKALANAKGDFVTLKNIVGNQLNNMLIRLGQTILPPIIKGLHYVSEGIKGAVFFFKDLYRESVLFRDIIRGLGSVIKGVFSTSLKPVKQLFDLISDHIPITAFFNKIEMGWISLKAVGAGVMNVFRQMMPLLKSVGNVFTSISNPALMAKAAYNAYQEFKKIDFSGAFKDGFSISVRESVKIKREFDNDQKHLNADNTIADSSTASDGITTTEGASLPEAQQVKSLIVNIEAVHKGDNIIRKDSIESADSMSIEDFEELMNEHGLRLTRNLNRF